MEEGAGRGRQGGASNVEYFRSIREAGQAHSRPGTFASKSEEGPFLLVELEEGPHQVTRKACAEWLTLPEGAVLLLDIFITKTKELIF